MLVLKHDRLSRFIAFLLAVTRSDDELFIAETSHSVRCSRFASDMLGLFVGLFAQASRSSCSASEAAASAACAFLAGAAIYARKHTHPSECTRLHQLRSRPLVALE
eukprot:6195937-Pleurochrysis_carterae.AAC.1